ncbi:hypothetical protein FACS1894147_08580 [Spirochaetia bacterium]|nr:hypothetical protein FACS1894147_08580 [Spirochaetia bacterium]
MPPKPGEAPFPWTHFDDFISGGADRQALLEQLLTEADLPYSIVNLEGNRHIFVCPKQDFSLPEAPARVILTAHYDRTDGSPGANDNSASVFLLLETALKLRKLRLENWLFIFTDKEELHCGESLTRQGSYRLALALKQAGLSRAKIFSFDACGSGDTLIISTAADHLLKNENGPGVMQAKRRIQKLRDTALDTARNLGMDKVLLLPTPFSDDAGFLRGGLAAQTITVLPEEEASSFAQVIRKNPAIAGALVNRDQLEESALRLIPATWQSLNSPEDSSGRLTPKNYNRIIRFAAALCGG